MLTHRRLLLSLALSALVGLITTSGARAETISMTISLGGGATFLVDGVATATAQGYTVDAGGLAAINSFLLANGSQYQFGTLVPVPSTSSLGGSSNFPGTALQGQLAVTGEIHSVAGGGTDTVLKITETEAGFTSPTGPTGTLRSSSSGNFTNQPAGGGQTALSMFNATSTPTYTVLSTGTAVNPGTNTGPVSVGIAPVSTLYTLANVITFGLAHITSGSDIVDSFGVTATITAAAVPEPASLVTMLLGIPLPLVVLGLLRRRRLARA